MARGRAAPLLLWQTAAAANKEPIAIHIGTVIVDIPIDAAMFAMGDRGPLFLCNRDDEPIVKDKQLPLPMICPLSKAVANHPPLELIDLLESLSLQNGRIKFTPNPPGAVHHDRSCFRIAGLLQPFRIFGKLPKRLKVG